MPGGWLPPMRVFGRAMTLVRIWRFAESGPSQSAREGCGRAGVAWGQAAPSLVSLILPPPPHTPFSSSIRPSSTPQKQPHTQADYLCQAADAGDLNRAKALLARGAPADGDSCASSSPSSSSSPPLFLAALGGHRDVVVLLISHGADPAHCGPEGTALMAACAANSAECVQALLAAAETSTPPTPTAAADPPARLALAAARHPRTGETALHVAARSGAADAARALLEGVSSSAAAPSSSSSSSSAAAATTRLSWARDARGRTPAVAAGAAPCGGSSIEVMALLLASASAASYGGTPQQHHSSSNRSSPASAGPSPSAPSPSSSAFSLTPAASYASSSSPPSPSSPPATAAPAAAAAPPGADTTAIHLAAARGNGPLCSALLAACGSRAASRHDARGALPLHLAARCARFEAARILCRAMGFRAVRLARDASSGCTPLHEAAKSLLAPDAALKAAMAALLIEAGCDPAARDKSGRLASDYDADVMPPVELERVFVAGGRGPAMLSSSSAGGAAVMAATAKLALELAREDAEAAAAAEKAAADAATESAAAEVVEEEEKEEEAAGDEGEDANANAAAASARASVVLAASAASAKAIAVKEQEADERAAEERPDGWRI